MSTERRGGSPESRVFRLGEELEPLVIGEVTKEMIAEYSRVSKDPNPMHTDEELARSMGYPGIFAQGMLGMAYLTRHLVGISGAGKLRRIKVRFKTMTWPGERITCRARVASVESMQQHQRVTCDIHTENQDGEPKVVGTATFEV
jgi:acyl dehydratase